MGDTRFAYRRFGNPAATPVVFTQHLMGNLDNFDPAISDALAAGREVILFDNAGVAATTGTASNNIVGMAADAARFIDEPRPGHGRHRGPLHRWRDRPNSGPRAARSGSPARSGGHRTPRRRRMGQLAPDVAALFTKWDALGEDMWLPIMFSPSKESQAAGRAFINRITARTEDRDIPVSDSTITAYRAAASQWGTPAEGSFEYLSRIAQPTLIVNGNNDIIIPTINSYHLYQNLPNGQLWLLPDANHGAHFQYPALFARRVIDFLDIQPHDTSTDPPKRPR